MKSRIILSILLIAMIPGLSFLLHQAFVPEQATELALQQMIALNEVPGSINFPRMVRGADGIYIAWTQPLDDPSAGEDRDGKPHGLEIGRRRDRRRARTLRHWNQHRAAPPEHCPAQCVAPLYRTAAHPR